MSTLAKNAIYQAYISQLRNKKPREISVSSICRELKISRVCFYYYFQDIYDLAEYAILNMLYPLYLYTNQSFKERIIKTYSKIDFPLLKKIILFFGSDAVFSSSSRFHAKLLDTVFPEDMNEEEKSELRNLNMAFNCSILGLLWMMSEQKASTLSPMIGNVIVDMMPQKLDEFWKRNQPKVTEFFKDQYPDIYELSVNGNI